MLLYSTVVLTHISHELSHKRGMISMYYRLIGLFQGVFIVSLNIWEELFRNLTCAYFFKMEGTSTIKLYKVGPYKL